MTYIDNEMTIPVFWGFHEKIGKFSNRFFYINIEKYREIDEFWQIITAV